MTHQEAPWATKVAQPSMLSGKISILFQALVDVAPVATSIDSRDCGSTTSEKQLITQNNAQLVKGASDSRCRETVQGT